MKKLRVYAATLAPHLRAGLQPNEAPHVNAGPAAQKFTEFLSDDLNIAGALAVVFEFIADPPGDADEAAATLRAFDQVLAVLVIVWMIEDFLALPRALKPNR